MGSVVKTTYSITASFVVFLFMIIETRDNGSKS